MLLKFSFENAKLVLLKLKLQANFESVTEPHVIMKVHMIGKPAIPEGGQTITTFESFASKFFLHYKLRTDLIDA